MAKSEKRTIYYFTGTGNSLRAAQVVAKTLGNAEIISMRCNPADVPATDSDVIGFVFPIYHWTLTEAVYEFISKLSINPNAYIFAVSTLCRINGYAFEVLDELLKQKGAFLQYAKRIYSIANLCIVYPPFPSERGMIPRMERNLKKAAIEIQNRKMNSYSKAGGLTRLLYPHTMPQYLSILHEIDKGFSVSGSCISCGLCSRVCPRTNISIVNGSPTFSHNCSCCMACVAYCPTKAIQYRYPKEQRAVLDTFFTRKMKLPAKRKRYHHPYITAQDLMLDRMRFD
jgi:ferredoxin/flavodoxin